MSKAGCLSLALVAVLFTLSPPAPAQDGREDMVSIRLSGAELSGVVLWISDYTGKPVLLPDGFPGDKPVDVISSTEAGIPMSKAMEIIASVLRESGYGLIERDNFVQVVRQSKTHEAPVRDTVPGAGLGSESLVTTVVQLEHAKASALLDVLSGLGSPSGSVKVYADTNKLVLTDNAPHLRNMMTLVRKLDQGWGDNVAEVVRLEKNSTRTLLPAVQAYLRNIKSAAGPREAARMESLSVEEFTPTNSLLVFGHPEDVGVTANMIRRLDVEPDYAARRFHTYMVLNRDAGEMAQLLENILSATTEDDGEQKPTVIADVTNNALVVVATPERYREMEPLLRELDRPRAQVLIESALVELSMDAFRDLGVELASLSGPADNPRGFAGTTMGLSQLTEDGRVPLEPPQGGLTAGIFKDNAFDIPFLVRLSHQQQDVSFIAAPRLLASDNSKATVRILEQREFQKDIISPEGRVSGVTHGGFLDAGITLDITPHVNKEGGIRLKIHTEIDEFLPSTDGLANRNTRSAETEVDVADGYPVVIAGLTRTEEIKTKQKVPLLGDIPLLGFLFSRTNTNQQQRNLCIFIKPRVLRTKEAIAAETDRRREDLRRLAEEEDRTLPEEEFDDVTGAELEPAQDTDARKSESP